MPHGDLECVVNVAEGRNQATIEALAGAAGSSLIDLHSDPDHHRSVFTLAGPQLVESLQALARRTIQLVDLREHRGVHPRIGVLDVVPFAPLPGAGLGAGGPGAGLGSALEARNAFAAWAAAELGLPCFLYGPERSLPDIRRGAFVQLTPDWGPVMPSPGTGAVCVGGRPLLVAYNLWLETDDLRQARQIATAIRRPHLRVLALALPGGQVQVSCNLLAPEQLGPAQAYDAVSAMAPIIRAELVGLIPATVLGAVPPSRWEQLDLSEERTIEARLARAESSWR